MIKVGLFFEDEGHRTLLASLCERIAREEGLEVQIVERNAAGGQGRAISELKQYSTDLRRAEDEYIDILVVAIDGNCTGPGVRARLINKALSQHPAGEIVLAIPDPHVERWYLADPGAIGRALGVSGSVAPPDQKCDKNRYKTLLNQAFAELGELPAAGGIEYGDRIAEEIDLNRVRQTDQQLTDFIDNLRRSLRLAARTSDHAARSDG